MTDSVEKSKLSEYVAAADRYEAGNAEPGDAELIAAWNKSIFGHFPENRKGRRDLQKVIQSAYRRKRRAPSDR